MKRRCEQTQNTIGRFRAGPIRVEPLGETKTQRLAPALAEHEPFVTHFGGF